MSRLIRAALAASIVALVVMGASGPASADGPTILGAGSTWSEIAIRQWASDVSRLGISVNYQGVGSTQGRQLFAGGMPNPSGSTPTCPTSRAAPR
jgi:ABC-type phosphate transport system substrate-binding protein